LNRESLTMEFKRECTEDIKKIVISFANTEGGEILIGVDNDGAAVGVIDADEIMLKATNAVRDSIKPDVTMFVVCEAKEIEGKMVVAVFEGSTKTVFKDIAEFSGLKRIDMRDYPPEAIREALLNAIVHRDYSYSNSILIRIFDDRIEFVSPGGLPKGIDYSDLMLGVSVLRNNGLAHVFYRLSSIEAFGTGIPRILECYHNQKAQPAIEVSDNAFKVTLPNTNFLPEVSVEVEDEDDGLSNNERKVMRYLARCDTASRREIEAAIGLSQTTTIRVLNALVDKELILKLGGGKNTRYAAVSG
jgi:ATP-dependent DNA helicase RecG